MPTKRFIFKKDYLSRARANGLMKALLQYAESDRAKAEELYAECKSRLDAAENNEEFSNLISSTTSVLNQMQNTSKKLVEAMGLIYRFLGDTQEIKVPGLESGGSSLFSQLSKLTSAKKEPDEENT